MAIERYAVYVDVSAKIEAWNKPSMVAVANDRARVLLVAASTKQILARLLIDNPEPVQYLLLAAFAYLAVKPNIDEITSITLDRDYSGPVAERRVLRRLLQLLRQDRPKRKASAVRMQNIAGRRADTLARQAYRGLRQPDGEITVADVATLL